MLLEIRVDSWDFLLTFLRVGKFFLLHKKLSLSQMSITVSWVITDKSYAFFVTPGLEMGCWILIENSWWNMGSCRDIYSHLLLESWLWLNDNLEGWLHKRCFRWKDFFNLFDYLWLLYWCLRFRNLYSNWCLFLFYWLNRDLILNYRSRCLDRCLIFSHRRSRNFFPFYRSRNLFLFYRNRNFFLF